jgi:hypothetical protein
MTGMSVSLNGSWLHLATDEYVSGVKWSDRYGDGACGPDLASCAISLDPSNDSPDVRIGRAGEVWDDGVKVFGGRITDMGRDYPRPLSFAGYGRRASDFDAIDATGAPTMNPRTAVTQAIADGLEWTDGLVFPNVAVGATPSPMPLRLDDLLNQAAVTSSKRWGVDAEGAPFWVSDPTTPMWFLDASDLDIGVATDGLYTRVRATYVSSVDATTGEADGWDRKTSDDLVGQPIYGVIVYPMDLTPLGLLTGSQAQSYADQQLALLTVPQWLSRVTTNSTRLLTEGGLGAPLSQVHSGQMVRLFNTPNNLGGLRNEIALDVILGETEHDSESPDEITIAPIGLAVRNLADALAQAAEAAKKVAA